MRASLRRAGLAAGVASLALATVAVATPVSSPSNDLTAGAEPQLVVPVAASEAEAVTVVSHATADGQPRAYRARRGTKGYTLSTAGLVGHTPKGLNVWVDPKAKHRKVLAQHSRATVKIWKRLGIKARYRGFGTPKVVEGVVTVTESRLGCQNGHAGVAYQSWMPLGDDKFYVNSGRVHICPSIFTRYERWQWSATIRHELGHTAGLGHFDGVHGGTTQVMKSQNTYPVSTFKSGDLAGLRFFANGSRRVKALVKPEATLDVEWGADELTFDGTAKLAHFPRRPVKIVVTEGAQVIASGLSRPAAGGTYSVTAPRPSGSHTYCVTAVSPVNKSAQVEIGCATFS